MCSLFIGLPPGVINLVFGTGPRAGEAIVKHPDVPVVSFTGGTVTAVKLRLAAAPFSKKLSLEVRRWHSCIVLTLLHSINGIEKK